MTKKQIAHIMTPEQNRVARVMKRMEYDLMVIYRRYHRMSSGSSTAEMVIGSNAGDIRALAMSIKTRREMLYRKGWVGQI